MSRWTKLCSRMEMNLNATLPSGQAFRWQKYNMMMTGLPTQPPVNLSSSSSSLSSSAIKPEESDPIPVDPSKSDLWIGVIRKEVVALLQTEDDVFFRSLNAHPGPNLAGKLHYYFQLQYSLPDLIRQWSSPRTPTETEEEGEEEEEEETKKPKKKGKKKKVSMTKVHEKVRQALKDSFEGNVGKMRLMKQPPAECTMCFICSQNNNIQRITSMVDGFCCNFGELIPTIDSREWLTGLIRHPLEPPSSKPTPTMQHSLMIQFHAFPSLAKISEIGELKLRDIGFGYRAAYIPAAATQILGYSREEANRRAQEAAKKNVKKEESEEGEETKLKKEELEVEKKPAVPFFVPSHAIEEEEELWFDHLMSLPTKEDVQRELTLIRGVGRKVADCIQLFSLKHPDVIPVDTHVRQIAERYMNLPVNNGKTVSDDAYRKIGKFFKDVFGEQTGWAHQVLFANEIREFNKPPASTTFGNKSKKNPALEDEESSSAEPEKKRARKK